MNQAIGLIETLGMVGLVQACDAMAKTAQIEVVKRVEIGGGYVTSIVRGDEENVRRAVYAGAAAALSSGELVASHVIADPHEALLRAMLG